MSNPFDTTSSPFAVEPTNGGAPKTNQTDSAIQEDFAIHTMQDDLEQLAKKPTESIQANPNTEISSPKPIEKKPLPEKVPASPKTTQPVQQQLPTQTPKPNPFSTEKPEAVEVKLSSNESSSPKSKLVVFSIVFIVLALFAIGGLYYWLSQDKQPLTTNQPTEQQPIPEQPAEITQPIEKYSATNPNFLPLDLNTLTSEQIRTAVKELATEIQQLPSSGPYEFIIVDKNNNPVSFPIFATAVKFNLLPSILTNLEDAFSLFLYKDGAQTRLALKTTTKNKSLLETELPKQEKTFVKDADFLFLGTPVTTTSTSFKTGNYQNQQVRYLNLNETENLSIDYMVSENQLLIASSKNTLRVVYDKNPLAAPTTQTAPNSSVSIPAPTAAPAQSVNDNLPETNIAIQDTVSTPGATPLAQ